MTATESWFEGISLLIKVQRKKFALIQLLSSIPLSETKSLVYLHHIRAAKTRTKLISLVPISSTETYLTESPAMLKLQSAAFYCAPLLTPFLIPRFLTTHSHRGLTLL